MKTKELTQNQTFEEVMAEARNARAEAEDYLRINGIEYKLSEWVSPAEYVKKFNLANLQIVNNWIARGIIPENCIVSVPGIKQKLIKAVPYKEEK